MAAFYSVVGMIHRSRSVIGVTGRRFLFFVVLVVRIRSGVTGNDKEHKHIIEYNLKLDSNPEFTGSVLAAYARAAYRLSKEGSNGCKTVFDIAPAYLSAKSAEELRGHLL